MLHYPTAPTDPADGDDASVGPGDVEDIAACKVTRCIGHAGREQAGAAGKRAKPW